MLRLSELTLENFFSHKYSNIDFTSKNGLVLIEGINNDGRYDSNGSGKSSILEGIVYAISGNTLRNVGVNDMINRKSGKDTHVNLKVLNEDTVYSIDRYRKDTVHGDKLLLCSERESSSTDLTKRLNKDTQSLLDSIIDIPYEVLINTILLGEGLSSRFTQLSDAGKKSLIESTLNLSYDLESSRKTANTKLKSLNMEKSNLQGQITTLESMLSEGVSEYQKSLEEYKSRLYDSLDKETELNSQIQNSKVIINSLDSKISILTSSINSYKELSEEVVKLDREHLSCLNSIELIEKSDSPRCTLCGQNLQTPDSKDVVINKYRDKICDILTTLEDLNSKLSTIPSIDILESKLVDVNAEYHVANSELAEQDGILYNTKLEIANCTKQIENLQLLLSNYEVYKSKLEDTKSLLLDIERSISDYEYFYKLFSPTGLMTIILQEAISYINSRLDTYTEILIDKSYHLEFDNGKILLKDNTGASYQSLSNGEKRRLDLCIQFSLHDYTHIYCGASIDTLFLDEALDTLDNTGIDNILTVLRMKQEYCKLSRIIVITHNNTLKSYFDEVITVMKDEFGNSSIV